MSRSVSDIVERAREAYEQGDVKRALKLGWDAGTAAAAWPKQPELRKVEDLARLVMETSEGRLRDEARSLAIYCAAARANPKQRFSLLTRSRNQSADTPLEEVKICPDCAEEVKAAARVCRFCGYRFDDS
jgi:hypothetical protein